MATNYFELVWNIPETLMEHRNLNRYHLWVSYDPVLKEMRFSDGYPQNPKNKQTTYLEQDLNRFSTDQILLFMEGYQDPIHISFINIVTRKHPELFINEKIKTSVFSDEIIVQDINLDLGNFNIFRFYGGKINFGRDYLNHSSISQLLENKIDLFSTFEKYDDNFKSSNVFMPLFSNDNIFSYEYYKFFKTDAEFKEFHRNALSIIAGYFKNDNKIHESNNRHLFLKVAIRFSYIEDRKVSYGNSGYFPYPDDDLIDYFKLVLLEKIRVCNNALDGCDDTDYHDYHQDNLDAFEGDSEAYYLWQNE